MKQKLIIALFKLGFKGRPCWMCSFSRAAHYEPDLEFDIDDYPCGGYMQLKDGVEP